MKESSPFLYTTCASVKVRLANKVQFQAEATLQDGELPDALLDQLIQDAETEVEQDLRGRYAIPFQSKTFGTFDKLPDHTKRAIRMAVDLKAVLLVLMTDFGRSGHADASKYYETQESFYTAHIDKLLGRDREAGEAEVKRHRRTPPLEDLLLAATNREADDGYRGMIINTDQSTHGAESYAAGQINNPAAAYVPTRRGGVIP